MYKYLYTLLFVCLMTKITGKRYHTINNLRVHYGDDIKDGEYEYVVSLFKAYKNRSKYYVRRICTASVIAEQWTLTAAHCFENEQIHKIYVWYQNFTVSPLHRKLFSKILKNYIHPSYRNIDYNTDFITDNDITLLHTNKITLKSYGRISAVDHMSMIGLPVTYVGGGGTNHPGDDEMRPLQVGEAIISTCDALLKHSGKYIICISPKCSNKMQRPWMGDSGGPLIYDGKIIGVASFGTTEDIVMEAYVPTSPYIEWLYGVMHSVE